MLMTLVVSLALSGAPKADPRLVGTWLAGQQTEEDADNGGLWEVRNGQLWGSYGNAPLQLVQPFSVTRNSNG